MVMPALLTEDLERREAVLGVDVEHLPDEILGSRRDMRPWLAGEVKLAAEDGGEDAVLILRPEGRHAGEEDVEHDADAPDVGLWPVPPLEHLRRDVVGAAEIGRASCRERVYGPV